MDTEQDKSLEETETKETAEAEETMEPEEDEEEQPISEEALDEELIEEAKPTEEEAKAEADEAEEEAEKKKREEEIVEERIYTIPLSRGWISPRKKRAPRAVRIVKSFIQRHMKIKTSVDEEEQGRLVISNEVNEKLWSRGIGKPPRNIRVRAVKDREGTVTLYLAEGD